MDIKDEALLESHYRAVYGFVLRSCSDPTLVQDLAQEVFLRALGQKRVGRGGDGGRPWLLQIARNLLIDRWRESKRRPPEVPVIEANLVAAASGTELRSGLRGALAGLPRSDREAFLMREVAGLSYFEIAEITGSSEAAVRSRIYRARRKLKFFLGDWQSPEGQRTAPTKENEYEE